MTDTRAMFMTMPDAGIITDAYGYILEFNTSAESINFSSVSRQNNDSQWLEQQTKHMGRKTDSPGDRQLYLRKGRNINRFIVECLDREKDILRIQDKVYEKNISSITDGKHVTGYTISLIDITELTALIEAQREKSQYLDSLVNKLMEQNAELERLALQAKELTDYSEQLAIARKIHDDEGHAITAIHSISEMCLKLMASNPGEYERLILEGIGICEEALSGSGKKRYNNLQELLNSFSRVSQFPLEISVEGEEPDFLKDLYEYIARVCKEAYHNTLSHSLADKLFIVVKMSEDEAELRIQDNGRFRGRFLKGFGLQTMEDYVAATGGELSFIANEGEGFGLIVTWRRR